MRYAVNRLTLLVCRFLFVAADWGFAAAVSFMLTSKFVADRRGVALPGSTGRFRHRGPIDRSVLMQFAQEFAYFDTSKGEPMRTIVDAGANIGVFSAQARRLYPGARIFALEVEPANLQILRSNAEALGGVEVLPMALWKERACLRLLRSDTADAHRVDVAADGEATTPAIGLRDLMDMTQTSQIDLLKMDIEGAEHVVFEGIDAETLNRINAIRFEASDAESAGNCLKLLERLSAAEFDAFACGENLYLLRRSTHWSIRRREAGVRPFPNPNGRIW